MLESLPIDARTMTVLAAILYGGAFGLGLFALLRKRSYPRPQMMTLTAGGFLLQSLALNLRGMAIQACPLGNPFEISQFIAWSVVLLFFVIGPVFRLRALGFFTSGFAFLLSGGSLLVPGWDHPYPAGIFGDNPWIEMHAALAIFSYAIFGIVALVSVMFLIQQHGLKKKHTAGLYQLLPSVSQLDRMANRLLVTGVTVLTFALAFGAVFWIGNPDRVPVLKLSFTLLVWAGYLGVVVLRQQKKLVTRRHAIASILLFTFALVSLWPVETARNAPASPGSERPASR